MIICTMSYMVTNIFTINGILLWFTLSLDIKHGHFKDGEDSVVNDDFDDEVDEDDDTWDFKKKKRGNRFLLVGKS